MPNRWNNRWIAWFNIAGFIAMIVINFLADRIPLFGVTTAQVSAKYPVLVTPAPFTFGIWGLIYFMLLLFVIYQALPSRLHTPMIQKIGYAFLVSCFFNSMWIVVWHAEWIGTALLCIVGLWATLLILYFRIHSVESKHPVGDMFFVKFPFSLYLGWVSVAALININIYLYDINWSGWGISEAGWAVWTLLVAAVLAVILSFSFKDTTLVLAFVWGLFGIGTEQRELPAIQWSAYGLAFLLLLYAFLLSTSPKRVRT